MPPLTVVGRSPPRTETVGERVRRLQAEAKNTARAHVRELSGQMASLAALASEIAAGGDVYAPGAVNLARNLAIELESQGETLAAIISRT